MKIGITTDILRNQKTGVEQYTYNLVGELVENFPETDFYIIREAGSHREFENFKILERKKRPRFFGSRFFYSLLASPDTFREFDLIHCPTHEAPFFRKLKTKTVVTIHDLTPLVLPQFQKLNRVIYFKFFLKTLLENFDHIITDSFSTKNDLMKYFDFGEEKISVVHLGVDKKFKPASPRPEVLKCYQLEPGYIFFMGTVEPRKNIGGLLSAFEKIREKFKIKLVIAGGCGWKYKKILKKMAATPDVVFLGYVPDDDLVSLYNGAKIFVYPSFYEGFGLPVLEALASGLPVITTNVSSIPEITGNAAILINPGNNQELAAKIGEVLLSENLQSELSQKALGEAGKFSWARTARETFEVYKKVVNS